MTIDEAIERYTSNAEYERTHGNLQGCLEFRQLAEWLKDYKRLKEQEPCNDAISREAVMHILDEVGGDFDSPREAVVPIDYIADMVSELPSVTAQPKMGRWIYTGDYITDGMLKCSECGFEHDVSERFSYCPNCGAKMSEIPTGQIAANGELYPGEFDDPLAEEGSDKE